MLVWKDKNGNVYWKKEINDEYLLRICNCLTLGRYDYDFINETIIEELFEEVANRGLMSFEKAHESLEIALETLEYVLNFESSSLYDEDLQDYD